ncbi:hypothetical protein BKA83DRAFT_4059403 [Pisolithus microcarpus]|nr:hypothetical protein BKA83DRAFT_4059403 [Pisolithus microcarpus]
MDHHTVEPPRCACGTAGHYLPVESLLTLPGGRTFTQYPHVASDLRFHRDSTPSTTLPSRTSGRGEQGPSSDSAFDCLTDGLHISQDPLSSPSRNSCRKTRQWQRWSQDIIPALIEPYLSYWRLSNRFQNPVDYELPTCNCQLTRKLKVICIEFNGLRHVDLTVCPCAPAALQLLWIGYFPCAPLGPTLAVSLQLLSLVRQLFMRMPPNTSAWCESFEAYLAGMGYKVDTKEGIRRRFSNAYHWYCILELSLDEYVQQNSRIRPSEYLRQRCPLCFGGYSCQMKSTQHSSSDIDAIVCIDACFTQKRRSGQPDDPINPTATVFLSPGDIYAMECEVDGLRKSRSSVQRRSGQSLKRNHLGNEDDVFEEGMRITTSVLKGCNESFTAADERRQKASTQFFSDTGVMALLCRHDRVIYLANMTSAGEKQHYALALVKALFNHLPSNFHVGLLYDIGCQLEQSCRKWGFLKSYLPRISFAISVFHAFGHQWACQLIYHPRKREGFGLSDGEGCERFWSSIKGLIPSLRVSGYHQRLFVIDFQVHHLDMKSLAGLGKWLLRRWNHCQEKKSTASNGLRRCGVDISTLQTQWEAQISAQTKPAPRHSSKTAENIVLQIMETQKSLENYEARLAGLEKDLLHGVADMTNINIEIVECHKKITSFKQALQRQRTTLGLNGLADLAKIQNSSYLQLRMHALAIKKRIRDRLHQRKFEMERLERSYRHTVSEQRLQNHTEASVKRREPGIGKLASSYNNLCLQMVGLIQKGKAPQGSIAPLLIPRDSLFKLDVDDDIWQDVGLGDDSDGFLPPWLADVKVRSGIRSLLDLRRCEEEERCLLQERKALIHWFAEEWGHLQQTIGGADDNLAYELDCRASALSGLCLMWQKQLRDFPGAPEEYWGASDEELHSMLQGPCSIFLDGDEVERVDGLDSDSEDEEDENGVLEDELIYVAEEFALADEYHQSDLCLAEFSWGDDWDNDLLDMDPPSSPSKRVCR